ncbi:1-acyl-sn-glycerol-3-phosphate acyltransferase, partial [Legionella sp.]|uniref:1-acyl-sn-glycerol-3-phosphate acyltransferase n=1 Tax=Legionella sp. TaxID=459 RepID=UPI0032204CC2
MLRKECQVILVKPMRWLLQLILAIGFRVKVKGLMPSEPSMIIVANCTSVIDPLLLALFLPDRLSFVFEPQLQNKLWIKVLKLFAEVFLLDLSQSSTKQQLIEAMQAEKKAWVLFPQEFKKEINKFDDYGFVLQQLGREIWPIRIDGAQHSFFSLCKEKHAVLFFPKITLH